MKIKKISKIKSRSFSKVLLFIIKAETKLLKKRRELFSPKKQLLEVKKAWQEKNRSSFIKKVNSLMFSTLIYWFLPGWFIVAICRILRSKKIWQLTITKIQFQISEHRLSIRYTINSRPLNFLTIVSILPFFVGFYDFLNQNQQLKRIVFQKNIPGFSVPTESLNWETFRYFTETKKSFLVETEKIHWSSNSLFLTKTLTPELFHQNYFIGSFTTNFDKTESILLNTFSNRSDLPNSSDFSSERESEGLIRLNDKNQHFGSNRIYLNLFEKQPFFPSKKTKAFEEMLQTFYLNLDEIPLKLDNLNSYHTFTRVKKNNLILPNVLVEKLDLVRQGNQSTDFSKAEKNESFKKKNYKDIFGQSLSSNLKNEYLITKQIPGFSQFDSNKVSPWLELETIGTNTSSQVDLEFSLEKQTSLFLKKALNLCNSSSLVVFPSKNNVNDLQVLVADLEQVLLEQGVSSLRRMSGYSYPDMTSKKLSSFLIHNLFSSFPNNLPLFKNSIFERDPNQTALKILFPANSGFINHYSFSNPKTPKVDIKTGGSKLKDWDTNQTLYNDLAIFLNKNNGLDWETPLSKTESFLGRQTKEKVLFNNSENLYFWLQNYFSPINPLMHSKNTILGKTVKSRNELASSQNSLVVPVLTTQEWEKIYNQLLSKKRNFLEKNQIENNFYITDFSINNTPVPLVEISLPKSQSGNLNFDLISTLDYSYSPTFLVKKDSLLSSKTNNLNGDIFPATLGENELFASSPSSYKKLLSIFNQPQSIEKTFFDNWEPMTFRSWLIVSQISFAFLFFNFLKYIITDYFNELISFIIDVGFAVGVIDQNLKEEIELLTGKRHKGFRIISNIQKKFQDIAGIKTLLPEIAEIVWFLRNSGKEFSLSKNFPRGLLLLGPPGTGKTLLVQALAGEAKVPVLSLSGSSLIAPGESGALKLEILFQEAREVAPCIVFIDEIDTLAQKREGVMKNIMGGDEIISLLESETSFLDIGQSSSQDFLKNTQTSFFKKSDPIPNLLFESEEGGEDLLSKNQSFLETTSSSSKISLGITQQMQAQEKRQQEQLTLLMQLLIELDGIQGRKGVVVIGATNRPDCLDSAILRPGRFDKIVELGLPNHEKRLEIFKLYGRIVGYDPTICWEYLSQRTIGFSAADLASIMNQSSLKAIINKSKHTLTTIEHGIDRITSTETEKPSVKITKLFQTRLAYYQAGKIVLSTLLEYHPPTFISYLWPRRQNRRSLQILNNLQNYFFRFARRCELEHRIVGSYGGKAAEILFLEKFPVKSSTFGLEDLSFGFVLTCFLIEKWYLYSKSTLISGLTQIFSNKNLQELTLEKREFFKQLAYSLELPPHILHEHEHETDVSIDVVSQNFFSSAWWQLNISQELEITERTFSDWYRLYLPNPEETKLNIEWSPPDEFYHGNLLNKKINKNTSITWNDLHDSLRDYQVHSFVIESFNRALCLLDDNREYLDRLVFELLKREVLRQPEIEKIASSFLLIRTGIGENSTSQHVSEIKIVNNSFGRQSRRIVKNWIDFTDFFPNSTKESSENL